VDVRSPARPKTAYEHSWEIRDLLGLSEFADREQDVRAFIAARVWASAEGPRALTDSDNSPKVTSIGEAGDTGTAFRWSV